MVRENQFVEKELKKPCVQVKSQSHFGLECCQGQVKKRQRVTTGVRHVKIGQLRAHICKPKSANEKCGCFGEHRGPVPLDDKKKLQVN